MAEAESTMEFPQGYERVKMQPFPKPQLRFWYEDEENGRVMDLGEQEAAVLRKSNQLRGRRMIGTSDGSAAIEVYKNCGFKPGQMVPYEKAKEIMQQAYEAELELARKGPKRNPTYRGGHYDQSILAHENRDEIIRGLGGKM